MSFFFFFAEMALFCLSWVLLEDGPLKGCVCVCVYVFVCKIYSSSAGPASSMSCVRRPDIPPSKINRTIEKQHTFARDLHLNFSSAGSPPLLRPTRTPPHPHHHHPFLLSTPIHLLSSFSHAFTVRYAESSLCCHGLWRLNGTKQAPKCTEPPRRPLNRILPLTSPWPSDNEWDHSFLVKPALMAKTIFAGMRGI